MFFNKIILKSCHNPKHKATKRGIHIEHLQRYV